MIYHMAGQSSGEKSFYEPEQNFKDNLISTFNIIIWLIKLSVIMWFMLVP